MRLHPLSALRQAKVAPSPGLEARLRTARAGGRADRAGPPLLRPAPSPRLPPFSSTPGSRFAPPARGPRGPRARRPRGPGRGAAAAPVVARVIFLFGFESARRRLAEDPLRPPPFSARPGGTGYPHPPHALKADLTPPEGEGGAEGTRASRDCRGPEPAAAPGVLGGAATGGWRRRLPFPCEAFTSLQGGTNQPRARPGRRGTAGAPGRAGNPRRGCTRASSERGRGGAQYTLPPGFWPLSPERLARASALGLSHASCTDQAILFILA